ncbi:MAG: hypothetical protein HY744_29640 [Deltaproteobacteria bacterium]|nr:hypothetical protein [Deltaproteobacteria bacterium]
MTSPSDTTGRPTDEELMMLLDGELDATRGAEVEAYAARDPEARAKLAGLRLAGDLLREAAARDARADGVAEAVMAAIAAQPGPAATGRGAEIIDLAARRAERDGRREPEGRKRRAGVQRYLALGAVAAAAAAGLMVWTRLRPEPGEPAAVATAVPATPSSGLGVPGVSAWRRLAAAELARDEGPAVEVASVDFGSRSGSVFYVSTGPGDTGPTTAVVWVTDVATGEAR